MATDFNVDLDHLEQIVSKLTGLSGFISDHLDEIDGKVASLTGTGWESIAAEAYQVAHQQWAAGAREFVEGIREISDATQAAHGRYTAAVQLNRRMLQGG
ncbi:hypothetical protein BOX37_29985 [Nocardia mangyaensis]|uniref:ESAT-6-like protein n=1 Tax=Nocardia mangyaensis TaxID=2213200 RepID=A0A1J0VZC7_9NOCA|nr:WXG100 family type VII secretion target [Nocardia mangyaensis]APE37456.1 hypothetical protein BOX37_29985 [Nocardia mangyaensis]